MNVTKNKLIASEVEQAINFKQRAIGLLGKSSLPKNHALWIHRCRDIHTFFMKFPIDVIFVDSELKVTRVTNEIKPWRLAFHWKASSVFEMNAGEASQDKVEVGDQLHVGS